MEPVTGLAALVGISLASMVGLRLKKRMEEGFVSLPDTTTNYPASVQESQSRYNMFSQMINPITNSIIPVGSSDSTIKQQKEAVNAALGGIVAEYSPLTTQSQTAVLKKFENQFQARSDSSTSVYAAIKFCRDAGKQRNPFTVYNSDGSIRTPGAVSPDGQFKFDEICGVCVTSGMDEENTRFRQPQGMLVEPSQRQAAYDAQEASGSLFPKIGPAIGTCDGAPNSAVFATRNVDLEAYKSRQACISAKTIGGADNCALCYGSDDVYSSVGPNAQKVPMKLALMGVGSCIVILRGATLQTITLSESTASEITLTNGNEGDSFELRITPAAGQSAVLYGYLYATTPNQGTFTMPLNLLVTIDDETAASPSKTGGFYTFSSVGLEVAKIRPGSGKTRMRLRGTLPFTFVAASEFSAFDCLSSPFQTRESSVTAFSTDQPCYARGSAPGKYNDACLQQRILDAGCTNNGSLYRNPSALNTKNGQVQNLTQIYQTLRDIADQDMVDTTATAQCSGRTISTPCDPFIQRAGTLKFASSLQSTNATLKQQAEQCLSFLYHNKGASETVNPPRVGPTYTGLVTYRNNQKVIKNLYCLPEGALNPDTNTSGKDTLARIGDNGYKNKIGVEAIKQYLMDQLALSIDTRRNANSDPDRKAAIVNCFGSNLNSLPAAITGNPITVVEAPPLPTSFTPTFGRNVGTVETNGNYRLTMTITPRGTVGNWSNIVHFTKSGRDCCTAGDRMPAIWFFPGNLRLHVRVGDTRDGNWGIDSSRALPLNTPTDFTLECNGSTVRVQIGSEIINATQPNARPTGTATVFMSDSFYPAANCNITNFRFTPL